MSEKYYCPSCPDIELIKKLGNLLVCPECDLTYVTRENYEDFIGKFDKTIPEPVDETRD